MLCQLWAAFEKSRVPQLLILAVPGALADYSRGVDMVIFGGCLRFIFQHEAVTQYLGL